MNLSKAAFFYELNEISEKLVISKLKDNYVIYVWTTDIANTDNDNMSTNPEIKKAREQGKILIFTELECDPEIAGIACVETLKQVDHFFKKTIRSCFVDLIPSDMPKEAVIMSFKRDLAHEIYDLLLFQLRINKEMNEQEFSVGEVYCLEGQIVFLDDKKSLLDKNIKLATFKLSLLIRIKNKIKNTSRPFLLSLKFLSVNGILSILGWLTKKIKKDTTTKPIEKNIGITPNRKEIFNMNYQSESILINDKDFDKIKAVMIDEELKFDKEHFKKHKLEVFNCYEGGPISYNLIKKTNGIFIKKTLDLITKIFKSNREIESTSKILLNLIKFSIFLDNYKIHKYLSWVRTDSPSKTMFLSKNGVETYYFCPDISVGSLSYDTKNGVAIDPYFTYMYYDHIIHYGEVTDKYFKAGNGIVGKYHAIGNTQSSLVKGLMEGKLESPLPKIIEEWKKKQSIKKIIGVFDTNFMNYSFSGIKNGEQFAESILKLLEDKEFKEYGIVLKAKKEKKLMSKKLEELYTKIETHPRAKVFYRAGEQGISGPEVVAFSDLTITALLSSLTIDAVCAGKRGIYYDINGDNKEKYCYFNKVPKFIAHGYDELKDLIKFWLEVSDEELKKFIDKNFKDVDEKLDGKAMERLKKILNI